MIAAHDGEKKEFRTFVLEILWKHMAEILRIFLAVGFHVFGLVLVLNFNFVLAIVEVTLTLFCRFCLFTQSFFYSGERKEETSEAG